MCSVPIRLLCNEQPCFCSAFQLGGAMAPAIKELSRWLDANSEYYVAPDWCDVVKHSVSIVTNEPPGRWWMFPSLALAIRNFYF